MIIARLLSPDDSVIREIAIPKFTYEIRVPRASQPFVYDESSEISEIRVVAVEFVLDREDTEFAQITEPNVYIYRQKGWLRDSGVLV